MSNLSYSKSNIWCSLGMNNNNNLGVTQFFKIGALNFIPRCPNGLNMEFSPNQD